MDAYIWRENTVLQKGETNVSEMIKRLAEDLENNEQLYQELTEFEGTPEELIGWLNGRGYELAAGELAEIASRHGSGLSDQALEDVAGGTTGGISEEMSLKLQVQMERRSKIIQTLSNILKKISNTQDGMISNIK